MAIDDKPTEAWEERDLSELCATNRRETGRLEFKGELRLDSRAHKAEAIRDAIGMANSGGGHIIYGIAEQSMPDGSTAAGGLVPLHDGTLYDRLNDVLDDSADPRLRFGIHLIDAAEDGIFIVVEINGGRRPHMNKKGAYFLRANQRVRPMSDSEVAEAHRERFRRDAEADGFTASAAPRESILNPVESRLRRGLTEAERAMRIAAGEDSEPAWLSIHTAPIPLVDGIFDPLTVRIERLQHLHLDEVWYGSGPMTYFTLRQSVDGFHARLPDRDDIPPAYTLDFWRDGLMEFGHALEPALRRENPDENRTIATRSVADYIHDYLMTFEKALETVSHYGTIRSQVHFDGVEGYKLGLKNSFNFAEQVAIKEETISSDPLECEIGELQSRFGPWIKHTIDRLFLAGGIATGADFLDDNGNLNER